MAGVTGSDEGAAAPRGEGEAPSSRRLRALVLLVGVVGLGALAAALAPAGPEYRRPPSFPGDGTVAGRPIGEWIEDLRAEDPARRARGLGVVPAVLELIEGPDSYERYAWFGDHSGLLYRDLAYFFPEARILVAAAPESLDALLARFEEPQPWTMDNPLVVHAKTLVAIGDPRALPRLVAWLEERRYGATPLARRMVRHAVAFLSGQTEEPNVSTHPSLSEARVLGAARRWLEDHPELAPP